MNTASLIVPIQITSKEFEIYLINLKYALEGAFKQNIACEKILVDYMSGPSYIQKLEKFAGQFNFKYIREDREDTLWSRGRALNIGIKHSTGDLILFFDADCVLPENYVREHVTNAEENIFTYSQFLPAKKELKKSGNYKEVIKQKELIKPTFPTCYSHKGLRRTWVDAHGAFDELYRGWGAEDDALWSKLTKAAQTPRKVDVHPIHLWHPTWQELMNQAGRQQEQEQSLIENRTRYFSSIGKKVKVKTTRKIVW